MSKKLDALQSSFDTLSSKLSFTSGVKEIAFHAWDNGFQIAAEGDVQKTATFDSNGINFYKQGSMVWHK